MKTIGVKTMGVMVSDPKMHVSVFKAYLKKARKSKSTYIQFQDLGNNVLEKIKV